MALISLENVSFSYDKKNPVLKNLSLQIQEGEYVAIIGHNGSGKSTLAKLLNALVVADSGKVCVDGFDCSNKKSQFEVRSRVGVVFQNPDNQLVASIVEDDVAFGPENLGVPRKEIKERIDFALDAVGMQAFRYRTPSRLSGGQKQRIAIAGVLALKPKVLVLDESTAMLDPVGRYEVLEVAERLNREMNTTIVAITHYMDEVIKADRVIVLSDGKIVIDDTPAQVFKMGEKLAEYGLELPLATQIAIELNKKGVPVRTDLLTEQELGEELCKLK